MSLLKPPAVAQTSFPTLGWERATLRIGHIALCWPRGYPAAAACPPPRGNLSRRWGSPQRVTGANVGGLPSASALRGLSPENHTLKEGFCVFMQRRLGPAGLNSVFSMTASNGIITSPESAERIPPFLLPRRPSDSMQSPSRPHTWNLCTWSPHNRQCPPSRRPLRSVLGERRAVLGASRVSLFPPPRPWSLHSPLPPPPMSTLWLESGQKGSRRIAAKEL